jgi:hypothetical protein
MLRVKVVQTIWESFGKVCNPDILSPDFTKHQVIICYFPRFSEPGESVVFSRSGFMCHFAVRNKTKQVPRRSTFYRSANEYAGSTLPAHQEAPA